MRDRITEDSYPRLRTPRAKAIYVRVKSERWIEVLMTSGVSAYSRLGAILLLQEIEWELEPAKEAAVRALIAEGERPRGRPRKTPVTALLATEKASREARRFEIESFDDFVWGGPPEAEPANRIAEALAETRANVERLKR